MKHRSVIGENMADRTIPDHRTQPMLKAPKVAAIANMSVRGVFAAAKRGDLPSVRVGRSVIFPTRETLAALNLLPADDGASSTTDPEPVVPPEIAAKIARYRRAGLSSSAIARALTADEVPGPGGEPWTKGLVEALADDVPTARAV
jgi:hypothetical protein